MGGLTEISPGFLPNDISKKIISLGKGCITEKFQTGAKVIFHFKTQLAKDLDQVIDDSRKMKKPMELICGKQFKLEIWETMLKSMGLSEVSQFFVPKKYLGAYPILSKTVRDADSPATAKGRSCCGLMSQGCGYQDLDRLFSEPEDLVFTFELMAVEESGEYSKESWMLSLQDKLDSIPILKESGNQKFKLGDIDGAKADYFLALSRIEQLALSEKPGSLEFAEFERMKVPLLLNFGFCLMKEETYYEAIQHLSSVLEIDPENSKAFFRRARCHQAVGNFDEALEDYKKSALLDPSLKASVAQAVATISLDKKKMDLCDRNTYRKLFT